MDISLLNQRITIQKQKVHIDQVGNHKNIWEDFFSCHTTVSDEGGQQQEDAGGTVDDQTIDFTVRCCRETAAVTNTGFRIIHEGTIYDILSVDHMNYKGQCMKYSCRKARR